MDRASADLLYQMSQKGTANKAIARELNISVRSVIRYLDFIRFHGFDEFIDFYINDNKPQFSEETLAAYADQAVRDNISFDRACVFFKVSQCKRLQELIDERRPRVSQKEKARQRAIAKEKLKGFNISDLLFLCEKDLNPFIENGIIFGSSDNETTRAMSTARHEFEKVRPNLHIGRATAPVTVYRKKRELSPEEIALEKSMRIKCPSSEPGVLFVTSISKFSVGARDLYLSSVVDCFNHEIVGYSISTQESLEAVLLSIKQALPRFNLEAGPILHSVKNPLYTQDDFKALLEANGIQQSLSYTGNYYNACSKFMASTIGRLKGEMPPDSEYPSVEALAVDIVYQIDFYNGRRIQIGLDAKSPIEYREAYEQKAAAQSQN